MDPIHKDDPRFAKWRAARVALLDTDPSSSATLRRTIRAAAAAVVHFSSVTDLMLDHGVFRVLVVNHESLPGDELNRAIEVFKDRNPQSHVLLFSKSGSRRELASLMQHQHLSNFMSLNDELDSQELLVTIQKMVLGDVFGIDKYFSWGAHAFNTSIVSSLEIDSVLQDMKDFADQIRIPTRLSHTFLGVIEELASNAIYNAPREDRQGTARPRSVPATLDPGDKVDVSFRFDGKRLGVSVTDHSGTLKAADVTSYLSRCFLQEWVPSDDDSVGAGLGLYQSFESLSHFVVNILPNTSTEVIGLMDVRGSYRRFASRGKSLNVFVEADEDTTLPKMAYSF